LRAPGWAEPGEIHFSTCAEENILAYQIDKYHAEDIMIHEFAHNSKRGDLTVYPGFKMTPGSTGCGAGRR
jgi:alpha-glucosidase